MVSRLFVCPLRAVVLFDPFPTLPDTSVAAALLALHTDVIQGMSFLAWLGCFALVAVASFMPVMRTLWLGPGSANANFYFNMVNVLCFLSVCLAVCRAGVVFMWYLRRAWCTH